MRCGRSDMRCDGSDMRCGGSDMRCGRMPSSPFLPSPSPLPQEWMSGATSCPSISAAVEASVMKENEAALRDAVWEQLQPVENYLQAYGTYIDIHVHT